jgi:hypothetical protein
MPAGVVPAGLDHQVLTVRVGGLAVHATLQAHTTQE